MADKIESELMKVQTTYYIGAYTNTYGSYLLP